ncbi:ATP-binding protein [Marinobacter lacisalsi]|uniref:histidine kinase n=1 Tax=Marinobacter lacisalsi TaxID=475979 RepID=A0ABV8QM49_9GAMM
MANTLFTRLSLGLFLLLMAVAVLFSVLSLGSLKQYNASIDQELNRDLAKRLVADRNLVADGELDQQALKALFELYMSINPSIEIYLLDTEGRILSYSADPDKIKRNRVSLEPVRRLLGDMADYPVLGDDPRSHDRRKVFSVTPVPSEERREGYLYVVLRGGEYDSAEAMARSGHYIEMAAWALGASLVVALLAGLAVFRILTRRLTRLTGLVAEFEHSDMSREPRKTWRQQRPVVRDEIDYLGVTFDDMASRITSQIRQLQEKDTQRRRLVAQVSHDLRTPLASIQGYIESLKLRSGRLSPQERDAFLDIALRESRRLGRLVDELFELASLEACERKPETEPFSLAELVYDVVQKHQQEADRRQVALMVTGDPAMPMASGDVAMTERVLDNLISNALSYSVAGGVVELCFEGTSAPAVMVRDAGPGIPEQDLPHIFDPFYRGSQDAGKVEGLHAGLGLAIARHIMDLQQGSIRAGNRAGGGAEFRIQLPVHRAGGA